MAQRVRIVKAVRVAGKDYRPGDISDFDDDTADLLVEQGYGVKEQVKAPPPATDFDSVVGVEEIIPTGGEGDQFAIDDLVGVPIVIQHVKFDKGKSGKLEGKDIATIQFMKKDGTHGWFTTWSGPLIAQAKQLEELRALPCRCMIEARQGKSGYRYYILAPAQKEQERGKAWGASI